MPDEEIDTVVGAAKPPKYAVGTAVRHPKDRRNRPPLFSEGEGTVSEVIHKNHGDADYRVKGADGAVLLNAFDEHELHPIKPPKPTPEPPK